MPRLAVLTPDVHRGHRFSRSKDGPEQRVAHRAGRCRDRYRPCPVVEAEAHEGCVVRIPEHVGERHGGHPRVDLACEFFCAFAARDVHRRRLGAEPDEQRAADAAAERISGEHGA